MYIRGNSVRDIASGSMPLLASDFYFPFIMVTLVSFCLSWRILIRNGDGNFAVLSVFLVAAIAGQKKILWDIEVDT